MSIIWLMTTALAVTGTPPDEGDPDGDECKAKDAACKAAAKTFEDQCLALPADAEAVLEQAFETDYTCTLIHFSPQVCYDCDPLPTDGTCLVTCHSEDGPHPGTLSAITDVVRFIGSCIEDGEIGDCEDEVPPGNWVQTDITYGVTHTCSDVGAPCGPIGSVCYETLGGAGQVAYEYTCL